MKKIFLIGLISLFLTGCGDKCESDVGAFVMSQNFVKQKLKFPSSAEFPHITDDEVYVFGDVNEKGLDVCKYSVYGYVEAKNQFGMMIINKYSVDLNYNVKDETWSATKIVIQ